MSDESRPLSDAELGQTADRPEDDVTREAFGDDAGALERSRRIRADDDARTDERQERLARLEVEAADVLRRNAQTLRQTAEGLAETREQVRRMAADTRELAADVRATVEDTEKVGEAVRSTPPVVDPATVDEPATEPPRGGA